MPLLAICVWVRAVTGHSVPWAVPDGPSQTGGTSRFQVRIRATEQRQSIHMRVGVTTRYNEALPSGSRAKQLGRLFKSPQIGSYLYSKAAQVCSVVGRGRGRWVC